MCTSVCGESFLKLINNIYMSKCFVTIGNKETEISPYIKDWAESIITNLEKINAPNECIRKIVVGTIANKQHLHNYCENHNLDFTMISKIVYK